MVKFRRKPVKKERFICISGPLAGYCLWLSEGSTGVFTVKGQTGKYIIKDRGFSELIWKEV